MLMPDQVVAIYTPSIPLDSQFILYCLRSPHAYVELRAVI